MAARRDGAAQRRCPRRRPAVREAHAFTPDPPRRTARYSRTTAFEADEQRARHDRVADRHFIQMRKLAEQHEVVQIEIVAGVDAEAEGSRQPRRLHVHLERTAGLIGAALEGTGERLGVKLHAIGAERRGEPHGVRLRLDEQAHANAVRLQRRGSRPADLGLRAGAPARLARDLPWRDRDERALIRADLQHQRQQDPAAGSPSMLYSIDGPPAIPARRRCRERPRA